jgi:hypothetical protein
MELCCSFQTSLLPSRFLLALLVMILGTALNFPVAMIFPVLTKVPARIFPMNVATRLEL